MAKEKEKSVKRRKKEEKNDGRENKIKRKCKDEKEGI